ncbi:hypothetical protein AAHC03_05543 [Spirometra sp. Aus1]
MSDLESVLADVSYLMAMEKSKTAASKAPKKHMIPDSSVRSVIDAYLKKMKRTDFDIIFNERIVSFVPTKRDRKDNCLIFTKPFSHLNK